MKAKKINFDLDLLPVISVMAICICILLINSVWTLIGSIELKQATGSVPMLSDKTPILVVSLFEGRTQLQLKNAKHDLLYNVTDDLRLQKTIQSLKAAEPVNAAVVLARKDTDYQKIISTLETLKNQGFSQVGLSSL